MFRVQLAYRHKNGDVEGFVGFGFTEDGAEQDCIRQMTYKCAVIRDSRPDSGYDATRIIREDTGLSNDEMENIRKDWSSGARYNPDGSIWRGGNAGPGKSGL